MADIFISYAHEDRNKVMPLVKALKDRGWSVWWDRTIPVGKTWDEVLEEQIEIAKCVVVVWSKKSIKSRWVRTEAGDALDRNVLVPVLIEDVKLSLRFRDIQAAKLIDWQGESNHPEFRQLLEALEYILKQPAPSKKASTQERQFERPPYPDQLEPTSIETLVRRTYSDSQARFKRSAETKSQDKGQLFKDPTQADYLLIVIAIFFGMFFCSLIYEADNYTLNLSSLKGLIVFLIAYRYGKKLGFLSA